MPNAGLDMAKSKWSKERFFSGSSLQIVPVAMAILHLCKGDVNHCIIRGSELLAGIAIPYLAIDYSQNKASQLVGKASRLSRRARRPTYRSIIS